MTINQYDVVDISLNPIVGSEIGKTRPCVVLTPNEILQSPMKTILVAPMTKTNRMYPTRVTVTVNSYIALDQMRSVDRSRVIRVRDDINVSKSISYIKSTIKELLVD